jgi:putative addiction module component (TIGR02574 family)
MATVDEVRRSALALSHEQREELARDLLLSLEPVSEADSAVISEEWAAEIKRRVESYERGEVTLLDWRESIAQIRQELRQRSAT